MQAVLLLAHKGVDYIENFVKQFDLRFNIYIHQDIKNKLSFDEIQYLYETYPNIKCILQKVDCKYSDISMIDAELIIIKEALQNKDNKYFHLMSEQCYLTVSSDDFYNIYDNSSYQYIWINNMLGTLDDFYVPNNWRIINGKYHYYGSQWFSLTYDLLNDIINDNRLSNYYDELTYYANNKDNDSHRQALDEVFFQNFIMEFGYINKYNFYKGIEDSSLRFVDWYARDRDSEGTHPGFIISDRDFSSIQLNRAISGLYTVVRKVDFKNNSSVKQLNNIKNKYKTLVNYMETQDKLVSVCMCTRNRSILMLSAIKSILSQTYKRIEFIIVNDCSSDDTVNILEQLKMQYAQIKVIHLKEHNFINARNEAFKQAKGDYICLIDSDDMCSPNKIEEQVNYLNTHKDIDVVGCKIKFGKKTSALAIPKTHNDWDNDYFQKEIKTENISMLLHFPAIMFRRELIYNVFPNKIYFYPELSNGGEDQIFMYTLYLNGARFANISSATYLYNYLEYDDAISSTVGQHFDGNNFIFKYIHNKPFDEKMLKVNELYNKYNTEEH